MTITKEVVQAHLDGLKVGLAQIETEYQNQLGAIREAEYWFSMLDQEEKKEQ